MTNLFREQEGVYRSLHPTHSIAAYGHRALEYVSKDDTVITECVSTPCQWDGCFGSLYDEDATILMLGTPLTTVTFIHSIEERLALPGKLVKEPRLIQVIDREGKGHNVEVFFGHVSGRYHSSYFFYKLEDALFETKAMYEATIGDAKSYVINTRKLYEVVAGILTKDPDILSNDKVIPPHYYEDYL